MPCLSSQITSQAQALPPELLLIIFKCVYEQIVTVFPKDSVSDDEPCEYHIPNHRLYKGNYMDIVLFDKDIRSQSLFPYAFASVCRAWRDVMESIPLFWTRLIFFVETDQIPLSKIRQSLQWSRDLPLDIYVLRKERDITDYLDRIDDHHRERAYIRELMPLLNTHLDRIKMMSFDLVCGSSLLRVLEDIRSDTCSHLYFLSLDCVCNDEHGPYLDPQTHPKNLIASTTPPILDLCMNGHALSLLLSHLDGLDMDLGALSVSCFTDRQGDFIDLLSFIEDFIYVTRPLRLDLDSIPFIWDPDEVEEVITMEACFIDMTLRNLPKGAADVIFRLLESQDDDYDGLSTITISQCSLSAPNFLFICEELYLKDIEPPYDLAGFISCWLGRVLEIENCPEHAIDTMLDAMAQLYTGFDWFNAPSLEHLSLIDCGNFSVVKLRHLWEVREIAFDPPLGTVSVIGSGPALSLSDRQWIEEHPSVYFDCDDVETDCD